jgi:hypothetical protein
MLLDVEQNTYSVEARNTNHMTAHVYCTDDEYNGDLFSLHVFSTTMFLNFILISNDNDLSINIYICNNHIYIKVNLES